MKNGEGVCIQLDSDYRIGSDKFQWIIEERMNNAKTGIDYWVAKWFYSSLENLLNDYIITRCRLSGAKTITELRDALENATKRVLRAVEPLDKAGLGVVIQS
jgi:hypothetical protein